MYNAIATQALISNCVILDVLVRYAKVLFCGAPKTGKTTFAKCFKSTIELCDKGQPQTVVMTNEGSVSDRLSTGTYYRPVQIWLLILIIVGFVCF